MGLIDGLLAQMDELHNSTVDAEASVRSFSFDGDKTLMSTVLNTRLDLPITLSPRTRIWLINKKPEIWEIEDRLKVEVFPNVQPFVQGAAYEEGAGFIHDLDSDDGYEIVCELPY